MTLAETGLRARTRRAILDAAFATLTGNSGASLSDVAAAAGVGRTTIHRYFPERSDLITAISEDLLDKIAIATRRARPDDGPAIQALDRLCQEYFELGDYLMLAFTEPHIITSADWETESPSDRVLTATIERAQREGDLDGRMPASWVQQVMWALLYASWQHIREDEAPKHDALSLCLLAFRKAVATS
ncbi:TetR/AcrR family transcriptional regulator [Nonomuraea typhae]|uniref:TetR/AcrR family transcriptional regulator n=1 Tax=Nonomuraea typhae TaxID=2603600 RepID=UPI0012FA86BE|nr:TetR family transcriptional regulator [Nonomuraea typhae]